MNMVYPMFAPPIAFVSGLGVRYFTEVRERKYVTNVFGRYLAKDVVAEVLASPEGAVASLSGASTPLAVLFADLRGFTSASEKATPPDVVAALNEYLEAMTRAVIEERGTIDKFMGDCVMAFWGAPRPDPDMVVRSVRAALKMQDLIDVAMATGRAGELKVKGCGVGLSFGEAVVGNIGSHERLDYTAIATQELLERPQVFVVELHDLPHQPGVVALIDGRLEGEGLALLLEDLPRLTGRSGCRAPARSAAAARARFPLGTARRDG